MISEQARGARIGIAGTGRVAQALGRLLREAGEPVAAVAGRDAVRTRRAAEFVGAAPATFAEMAGAAPRLLLAVSDEALGEVAAELAAGAVSDGCALHTSGAAGPEALAPLRRAGFACGSLHPLQTVCSPQQGVEALRGVSYAISGDPEAVAWAGNLVERLGGAALRVRPESRPLYHAAAVMASNYVVALVGAARAMLAEASGADPEAALRALAPLARAAMANVLERGPEAALTGPIERGDAATVARHLEALEHAPPAARGLYRAAGLAALEVARRKGLAEGPAARIEEMLRRGAGR